MIRPGKIGLNVIVAILALSITFTALIAFATSGDDFTDTFPLDDLHFASRGENPYFILRPGYHMYYEGEEGGELIQLYIQVLHRTKVVDGVRTRVVCEIEYVDGELAEISWNYFAICKENKGIFYFGEWVNIYEDGEVVSHEGSWLAGKDGARPGLLMPGLPLLGSRYFQEVAPGVAMDRAEHLSLSETVETPAATFENCLKVEETTPLEPSALDYKFYAYRVGLVQDGPVKLVSYGYHYGGGGGNDDDDD